MNGRLPFPPGPDETLDELLRDDLTLLQAKNGYRFSLDAVLLAMWADLTRAETVMDLGTGSGVILLLLSTRNHGLKMDGLEVQAALAERALRSVANNGRTENIRILSGDIRLVPQVFPAGGYDLVVSNPPFFRAGEGKVSPEAERACARHELKVTLKDVVLAARHLMRANGRFALILNAGRLTELLGLLAAAKLSPVRLRFVHPFPDAPATMLLAEAMRQKKKAAVIEPPLIVYEAPNRYSAEIRSWYGME